jgi:archaellum component FlaC
MNYILSNLGSISTWVGAVLTGGGIVAFFNYLGKRGTNGANARRTDAQTAQIREIGFEGYSTRLEARMKLIEDKADEKERQLEKLRNEIDELKVLLSAKDEEIHALQDKNRQQAGEISELRRQVDNLEQVNKTFDDEHIVSSVEQLSPNDSVITEVQGGIITP